MADHPFEREEAIRTAIGATRPEYVRLPPPGSHNGTPHAAQEPRRFKLLTDVEAEALPPIQGIVGDVLFEDSIAVLYAPSGRWKSFLMASLGTAVAAGEPWLGKGVKQGAVVMVAAEGARGTGKRVKAAKRRLGIDGSIPFYVVRVPVHLLTESDVDELIAEIAAGIGDQPLRLLIFDTLARSLAGGHENDTADAERLMDAAGRLRRKFGCCVLFIHHTGYDQTHMRGNTVFFNDADSVIRVEAPDKKGTERLHVGDELRIVSEKTRDSDEFATLTVTTEHDSWPDEREPDGLAKSLVIVPHTAEEDRLPLKGGVRDALVAIDSTDSAKYPHGLTYTEWFKAAEARFGMSKGMFDRHRRALVEVDRVHYDAGLKRFRTEAWLIVDYIGTDVHVSPSEREPLG